MRHSDWVFLMSVHFREEEITFKLPSSFLSKKHGFFNEASNIRSSFLDVMKMGNWLSLISCILLGSGWSSVDTKFLATSQAWLSSLKFFWTSLHRTTFFVMKIWWRWSYNCPSSSFSSWSSSPSATGSASSSGASSSEFSSPPSTS